jgi:exopolysaccharide biosynthesis operon protein EpsL
MTTGSSPVRTERSVFLKTLPALVGGALLTGAMPPARAADSADALNLYISQAFQWDDNLYRLPDDVEPFGDGQRDDVISITSFSALFDREYSRQRLRASLDVAQVAFDHWNNLDYSTKGGSLSWDWALGSRWSGVLSVEQDEVARDLADVGTRSESSINQMRTLNATANYWWHPDWAAGVGFERYTSEYSDEGSQAADYRASTPELSITYRPATGSRIMFKLRHTDGEYPNRAASVFSDEGFRQNDARLSGTWVLTGQSTLSGYLGYTRRTYQNLSVRDFSGPTGRLQHDWVLSGKFSLRSTVRREIGAREDLTDNFVVTKAVSLAPVWTPLARVAVQGMWEWRKRDFGGDPGLITGVAAQDDITRLLRLSVTYTATDNFTLSLAHTHTTRDSDRASNEYDANMTVISAQYGF